MVDQNLNRWLLSKYTWIKYLIPPTAYDVKACVLLIQIRLSDGDVKPGGLLGAFRQKYANTGTLPFIFITHTLHHNTALTLAKTSLYIILKCGSLK